MVRLEDDEYYEYIFHKYAGNVYRTSYQILKEPAKAQDAVQETFISFFRYNNQLKAKDAKTIGKWLTITARNASLDLLKKDKETLEFIDELYEADRESNPETVVLKNEVVEQLTNAIDHLDRKYAKIIQMRYYDELTVRQIAAMLNVSCLLYTSRCV